MKNLYESKEYKECGVMSVTGGYGVIIFSRDITDSVIEGVCGVSYFTGNSLTKLELYTDKKSFVNLTDLEIDAIKKIIEEGFKYFKMAKNMGCNK